MLAWVPFATNNYWALMIFKEMTLYFFFYLGIVTFVNSEERMQNLIFMWLGVHGLLGINGILHHGQGVGGWLGDENDFGMEMNVAVPLAFFMYLAASSLRARFRAVHNVMLNRYYNFLTGLYTFDKYQD